MLRSLGALILGILVGCGDGDDAGDIVVESLDFGLTDCGTTAIPRVLVVTNNTPNSFTFAIESSSEQYTVVPPVGVVLPRTQLTVTIFSAPIPSTSEVTENLYGGTLVVTTSRGDEVEVALTQTARGAILQASSTLVDFTTPLPFGAAGVSQNLAITNRGNVASSVSVSGPDARTFVFSPAGDQSVAAGATLQGSVLFTSTSTATETANLAVTATGPLCAPPPELSVRGTGTAAGQATQAAVSTDRGKRRNGNETVCVVTTNGRVACSGSNTYGMRGTTDARLAKLSGLAFGGGGNGGFGFNEFGIFNLVETETGILDQVVEIAAGRGHFCARRENGEVSCWGAFAGTGNRGETPVSNPFARVVDPGPVIAIAAGYRTRCTIDESANLLCIAPGQGGQGFAVQLGDIESVAMSGAAGYAVDSGGNVLSFGFNRNGERASDVANNDPPSIIDLGDVVQIAGGGFMQPNRGSHFACAIVDIGKGSTNVSCWGGNRHGQRGDGTLVNSGGGGTNPTPANVQDVDESDLENVEFVAAGHAHACAILGSQNKSSPSVVCWGRGREGQVGSLNFGDVTFAEQTSPSITNADSLALGGAVSCAVLDSGGLTCWGSIGGLTIAGPTTVGAFVP